MPRRMFASYKMLSKSKRLTKKEFDEVLTKGRIAHSPLFLVRYLIKSSGSSARMSAVAPQKIVKTAVARNGTRRKIYAAARELLDNVSMEASIIVFAKSPAVEARSEALKAGLKDVFVKAGIMR